MSYYNTTEEDLARAKQILARGKARPGRSPTINGGDTFAAYKLLESFVTEVEMLRAQRDAAVNLSRAVQRNSNVSPVVAVLLQNIRDQYQSGQWIYAEAGGDPATMPDNLTCYLPYNLLRELFEDRKGE